MKIHEYNLVASALWRSGSAMQIRDKNKVKQQARAEMLRLITTDLCASFAHEDDNFDEKAFLAVCGVTL
jgi:hypothetical protein